MAWFNTAHDRTVTDRSHTSRVTRLVCFPAIGRYLSDDAVGPIATYTMLNSSAVPYWVRAPCRRLIWLVMYTDHLSEDRNNIYGRLLMCRHVTFRNNSRVGMHCVIGWNWLHGFTVVKPCQFSAALHSVRSNLHGFDTSRHVHRTDWCAR